MSVRILAVIGAALFCAAAPPAAPQGVFELVGVRATSDVASTIDTLRPAEGLTAMIGWWIETGKFGHWLDGSPCTGGAKAGGDAWSNPDDPLLSDLQLKPGAADRRLNAPAVIE